MIRQRYGPGVTGTPQNAMNYAPNPQNYPQGQPGFYVPPFNQMASPSLDQAQVQAHQSQIAAADPRGPIQRGIGNFLNPMLQRFQNRMRFNQLARQGGMTFNAQGVQQGVNPRPQNVGINAYMMGRGQFGY